MTRLNPAAVALLGVGALAYTAGAVIYARRRPNLRIAFVVIRSG